MKRSKWKLDADQCFVRMRSDLESDIEMEVKKDMLADTIALWLMAFLFIGVVLWYFGGAVVF